ncbi:hypothetical protein GGF38_004687, partial [Coemansia sp. RSA 25]
TSALPTVSSAGAGDAHNAAATESPLASPRMMRSESLFRGSSRHAAESASQTHLPTTPDSPLGRFLPASLTNLDGQRHASSAATCTFDIEGRSSASHRLVRSTTLFPHMDVPRSPTASRDAFNADEGSIAARATTPTANAQSSLYQFRLPHVASSGAVPAQNRSDLHDAVPAIQAEEKTVPCIVLHVYGVAKPSKDMTQSLVQQIGEHITAHVTMPEMSDMLFRRVALNEHDMDFLFPKCNPEPTIVYLPLPQFVHNLDRLMLHFRQALGEIIVPFPASEILAKAMRRSYGHLLVQHDKEDDEDDSVTIGGRVPSVLRADLARLLEGWRYDRETPRRVPVEKLTFLYNFFTKSGAPPPEMTDIGTGIAIVSALPLSKARVVSSGIWSQLHPADPTGAALLHPAPPSSSRNLGAQALGEDEDAAAFSNRVTVVDSELTALVDDYVS